MNFNRAQDARRFKKSFHGRQLAANRSNKVCEVTVARVQGLQANMRQFRNSPINTMPIRAYRPLVFDRSGTPTELPSPNRPVRPVLLRNPRAAGGQKERIGATAKPEPPGPLVNKVLGKAALGVFLEHTTRAQC